jgi:hypothetical protein
MQVQDVFLLFRSLAGTRHLRTVSSLHTPVLCTPLPRKKEQKTNDATIKMALFNKRVAEEITPTFEHTVEDIN